MSYIALNSVALGYPVYRQLRLFRRGNDRIESEYFALEDISLRIEDGERFALLGRNGAGKTTLLKVIAGIFAPTRGSVRREGKVSTLLTTQTGMNPEATAYENIMSAGLLLGLDRKIISEHVIPDVAEFTELGKFMSMPMRTYSAGMRARLAFAISTSIAPQILLMDEMIGAGDAFFVEKARTRIDKMLEESSIVVLASHNLTIIRGICQRALVLDKGRISYAGDIESAIKFYKSSG